MPAVAETPVGAPGGEAVPVGTTLLDALEAGLVPTELVAVTVNVYVVPLVSPVTVAVVVLPLTVAVTLPGEEVTVYEVRAAPPRDVGGLQLTVAWALPAVALTDCGAVGTVLVPVGVTAFDGLDAGPEPLSLSA